MKCYDLFHLPSLKELQVVAGDKGLHKKLQWIHFVDVIKPEDYLNWVEKNELIILTGNNLQNSFDTLYTLLPELAKIPITGILFNIGMFITDLPSQLLQLADNLQLPIFTIPWEVKLSDVSKDICSYILLEQNKKEESTALLSELLFNNDLSLELQNKLINELHFPFHDGYRIGLFSFFPSDNKLIDDGAFVGRVVAATQYLKEQFKSQISTHTTPIITIMQQNECLLLANENIIDSPNFHSFFAVLPNTLQSRFHEVQVYAGTSRCYSNALNCRQALQEARHALWTAHALNDSSIVKYDKMGIFQLLTNVATTSELETIYFDTLQTVITYDELNHTELLSTFFCYLDHNRNLQDTANYLFIHKNTLKYRLTKLASILQSDLDSHDFISKMVIARNIELLLKVKSPQ